MLAPLGIRVEECDAAEEPLPFAENAFDIAISRRGEYRHDELFRVLRAGCSLRSRSAGGTTPCLRAVSCRITGRRTRTIIFRRTVRPLRKRASSCWTQKSIFPSCGFMTRARSCITRT